MKGLENLSEAVKWKFQFWKSVIINTNLWILCYPIFWYIFHSIKLWNYQGYMKILRSFITYFYIMTTWCMLEIEYFHFFLCWNFDNEMLSLVDFDYHHESHLISWFDIKKWQFICTFCLQTMNNNSRAIPETFFHAMIWKMSSLFFGP